MGIKEMLGGLTGKAKSAAQDHPDQAGKAVDKAGDAFDKKTGGKFESQVDTAQGKADEFLGVGGDGGGQGQQGGGGQEGQQSGGQAGQDQQGGGQQ